MKSAILFLVQTQFFLAQPWFPHVFPFDPPNSDILWGADGKDSDYGLADEQLEAKNRASLASFASAKLLGMWMGWTWIEVYINPTIRGIIYVIMYIIPIIL